MSLHILVLRFISVPVAWILGAQQRPGRLQTMWLWLRWSLQQQVQYRIETFYTSVSLNVVPEWTPQRERKKKRSRSLIYIFKVYLRLLLKVHDGERSVWLQEASDWPTVFRGSTWVFLCSVGLLQIRGWRCHWTLPRWLCTAGEHTTVIQLSSPIHMSGHYNKYK